MEQYVMAVFLLILGVMLIFRCILPYILKHNDTKYWHKYPCVIKVSEVKKMGHHLRIQIEKHYMPNIVYSYKVDYSEYTSRNCFFMPFTTHDSDYLNDIVNNYPPDSECFCFVNPANPSEAVLIQGFPPFSFANIFSLVYIGLLGLMFLAGGVLLFFLKQ